MRDLSGDCILKPMTRYRTYFRSEHLTVQKLICGLKILILRWSGLQIQTNRTLRPMYNKSFSSALCVHELYNLILSHRIPHLSEWTHDTHWAWTWVVCLYLRHCKKPLVSDLSHRRYARPCAHFCVSHRPCLFLNLCSEWRRAQVNGWRAIPYSLISEVGAVNMRGSATVCMTRIW